MKTSKAARLATRIAETRAELKRVKPRSQRRLELELHLKRMLIDQLKCEIRMDKRQAA